MILKLTHVGGYVMCINMKYVVSFNDISDETRIFTNWNDHDEYIPVKETPDQIYEMIETIRGKV